MTTLIKNGLIYDGSGGESLRGDVLIRGERIARFGNFSKKQVDVVVDATGAIVVPGFVDINSSSDHYLDMFSDGGAENLKRGVTTAIGGNCGSSLAPYVDSLKSVRKWGDISKINVDWHTVQEFLKALERKKIAVNFGTLLGHSTVRRSFTGEDYRDLTDNELAVFRKIIIQAFKEGAYGISTGLEFIHSKRVGRHEILELAKLAALYGRVYSTHLRDPKDETGFKNSINEILDIAKISGANVEISHFLPFKEISGEYLSVKSMIEKETADTNINFDCYLRPYIAQPSYQLLPDFIKEGNLEAMLKRINSEHLEEDILKHFKKIDPENLVIYHAHPPLKFLMGRTLAQLSESFDLKPEQALLKIMKLSHLRVVVLHKVIDEAVLQEFLNSSSSIIASDGLNFTPVFTEFLKWAKEKNITPLEKAVAKTTSIPAKKFNIKKRGLLKEDYYADIVVLRDFKPVEVLVNGALVLEAGNVKNASRGQILRCSN